jgi:putative FmdB family regulatory protein
VPTYAYACTACEHRFEIVQSFVDDSLTECPECAGRLRKLFNAVGVVFKGSGFYRTDSRNETRKGSAGSSSSGSSSGSSSTSSDSSKTGTTKTAAKSESSHTSSKTASTSQGSAA